MTRARLALGERDPESPSGSRDSGWPPLPSTRNKAHARLLIFIRGVSPSGHAPFLPVDGEGRNLEGVGGLRDAPRCGRSSWGGRLPPSEPPASAAAFARGGGPARREPGPLPASEPRVLCWRRRDWRACRRLLAPQRRPRQTLLGTLKNFPGARLAANSRESLGRAPSLPKSQSVEPQRAPSFLSRPRQGRGVGKQGERAACTRGLCSGFGKGLQSRRGLRQPPVPAQWRDCTCRRPPCCSLGGEEPPEKNLAAVAGHRTWLLLGDVETDAIFHLELGLAISSDTPGHNQGQREPAVWLKSLPASFQLSLNGTL
ncbi:uncharacterized protein LOC121828861 [Peromyscus maniculatus bairdii]|uniref:uncharacterized protein LOC121828861 n=1 Tax=Peromyscus maniculatus bairdii TaxID=230844 RepID=UPI003FD0CD36